MIKDFLSDEDFSESDDEVTTVLNALKQRGLMRQLWSQASVIRNKEEGIEYLE